MIRLVAILAAATLVVAPAASARSLAGGPDVLVIKVKSVSDRGEVDDRPPKGLSKGDRLHDRSSLLNAERRFGRPSGAVVGHDEVVIVMSSATKGTFRGVADLPGGTIRFRGVMHVSVSMSATVTGGTGRYARARGTITVGKGDSPLNTYRLTFGTPPAVVV